MRPFQSRMPRRASHAAITAGLALILSGCSDSNPTTATTGSVRPRLVQQRQGPSRTDTPWRRMTNAELSAKIAQADGGVFIGFKDPTAVAGVDEAGRVLANAFSVATGKQALRSLDVEITFEFVDMPMVLGRMAPSRLADVRSNPYIEYVEPLLPGTFLDQTTTWNVQRVRAPDAWAWSTGSGAKLLIIDSGIDNQHTDLSTSVVQTCMPYPDNGVDQFGHGTAVSGIAAAVNNTIQVVGVAYGVSLWSSKIGSSVPNGGYAACAVQFGRINNVHAMNMSFSVAPHTGLTDQINAAYNAGIVLVAAAGNTYGGAVTYPATIDAVIAVSATDTGNAFASFSAAGSKVEITAPGTTVTGVRGLTTTCLGGYSSSTCGFGRVEGTSFSAPHVAAAAAILKAYNPAWSAAEVRRRLGAGATDLGVSGRDAYFGYGLLDIPGAIAAAPPPPLQVSISWGPANVRPFATCAWQGSAEGGTPPYSFEWYAGGGYVGSGEWLEYANAGSDFTLQLIARDAAGEVKSTSMTVTVSSGAPQCAY